MLKLIVFCAYWTYGLYIAAVQYMRRLFYHGKSIPIVLENSLRASHNITNHILKIILEEVVGYESVEIRTIDSMNATAIMNRISGCPEQG